MGTVGVREGLHFDLRWEAPVATGTAAEATRGKLALWIGEELVWGVRRPTQTAVNGVTWSWIELLEHLGRRWTGIIWEEMDPLGLGLPPWRVRRAAEARWRKVGESPLRDAEERALLRFEDTHNLASALGGVTAPPLWLSREGTRMVLFSGKRLHWRPVPEVVDTFSALGDAVASRVKSSSDERATAAVRAWERRHDHDPDTLVSVATSLPVDRIRELRGNQPASEYWRLGPGADAPTEIMVAARMLPAQAPTAVLTRVLTWIRERRRRPTPDLDAMSVEALAKVREVQAARPFEMGYELATWLRSVPGIASVDGWVDPSRVLDRFGVELCEASLEYPDVDAICCWGPESGPAILVNLSGTHAQRPEGRTATLAHELCHLLVDRHRSLPVAEVLGGRCPVFLEQRSGAFAAELLLPRALAGDALAGAADPVAEVAKLRRGHCVSAEIVAWQAVRSTRRLKRSTRDYLRTLVTDKPRFDQAC